MNKEKQQDQIHELADKLSEAIQQLTGANAAIIFYGYYVDKEWRYGSTGKADLYQRIGLCEEIKADLLNKK